jgi:hypothetical protein
VDGGRNRGNGRGIWIWNKEKKVRIKNIHWDINIHFWTEGVEDEDTTLTIMTTTSVKRTTFEQDQGACGNGQV